MFINKIFGAVPSFSKQNISNHKDKHICKDNESCREDDSACGSEAAKCIMATRQAEYNIHKNENSIKEEDYNKDIPKYD